MRNRKSFAALSFFFVPISRSNSKPFSVRFRLRRSDRSSHSFVPTRLFLRAQERPATLILTVINGFRITRACHVYNRDAETGN